jgi:hypothetical protein
MLRWHCRLPEHAAGQANAQNPNYTTLCNGLGDRSALDH